MARRAAPPSSEDAEPSADQLVQMLNELKLTAAARALADLLRKATLEGLSYAVFLYLLLQTERGIRLERRVQRTVKRSKLRVAGSIDDFDFTIRPQLKPAVVRQLLDCSFVTEGRPICLVGKPGTGKTMIASIIGHAACMKGHSVCFRNTADLLDELHAALADNSFARVFKRYAAYDVLVCDELGYLPLSEQKADYLFRLVSARHPLRSTVITTNTAFKHWGRFFPNEAQAMATADRLLDRATVLRFTGKSHRTPKEISGAEDDDDAPAPDAVIETDDTE